MTNCHMFITKRNWQYYEKSCKGKNKYWTKEFAEEQRLKAEERTHQSFAKYKCKFCKRYHIGHINGKEK